MDASKTTTKLNLSIRLRVKTVLLIYGYLEYFDYKSRRSKRELSEVKRSVKFNGPSLARVQMTAHFRCLKSLISRTVKKVDFFSIRLRVKTVLLIYGCRIVFRAFRFRTGRASLYSLQIICLDKNLKFSNFSQIAIFTICTSHCLV